MEATLADFSGSWKMKSSENFEELLKALGVNVFLRKIAVAAASKPAVEITQQGESLSIQTSTSVRTTHVSFTSFPKWETDSKITCEQTLQKGEGPETSWIRELTNDGQMILTMRAGDVVCTRVYERD
ncbi:Cellular retinoic acid-binding protein 2 [Triplophysa tibetana]|uniref:Cellular retinoic acid-binding protein 2 n=1 Tax=Triplophysa tibetana TaxID=1572043 RepID=A0A5A9NL34_9TELE|nr:Cellular retinoic acid-binding protein 2 [Triplophysa tibetana]